MTQSTVSSIKEWVALDNTQFAELLRLLGQPDYLGIISQLLIAVIAAYSGYYFQKRFKKSDDIASKKMGIYRFNEAVTYIGVFLENITATLDQLVLKSLSNEEPEYIRLSEMMQHKQADANFTPYMRHSFLSIPPLEIAKPEQLISGIPDNGKYIELNLAFHRMRNAMNQFSLICEERNMLIKQLIGQSTNLVHREIIYLRYKEIYDRTFKLLLTGETILDAAMFIANCLEEISKTIREDFKSMSNEKISVAGIVQNEFHERLRINIRQLVDNYPDFKKRHLHIT